MYSTFSSAKSSDMTQYADYCRLWDTHADWKQ